MKQDTCNYQSSMGHFTNNLSFWKLKKKGKFALNLFKSGLIFALIVSHGCGGEGGALAQDCNHPIPAMIACLLL